MPATFDIKTRLTTPDDLGAIVAIYNQAILAGQQTADTTTFTVSERHDWFVSHTPDQYPIIVAEHGETVVGYLSLSAYRSGRNALRHTAEVSYFVDAAYRRRKIATRLLHHALSVCEDLAIRTVFAIVIDSNYGSIRFLEKNGFTQWGHMPDIADFDGVEVGHLYYGRRVH